MGSLLFTLIAGVAAGALTARTLVRREIEQLRRELSMRDSGQDRILPAASPSENGQAAASPAPAPVEQAVSAEITPEILMVLTAAVSAFLGKKAKIRRARVAQHAGLSSAWAQQGRVFVQASHNLPSHHH
jgi:methylmalonyl-CoA carboxyltransferase 12S subunit